MWQLLWGHKEQDLLEIEQISGRTPAALKNKPLVPERLRWYLEAFNVLSCSRPVSMGGVGSIPLGEIKVYCEMFEIPPDDWFLFVRIIRGLDIRYREHFSKATGTKVVNE